MKKGDMKDFLEANLLALSTVNPQLFSRLAGRNTAKTSGCYTFSVSRSGETVPVFSAPSGNSKPLHSMIDPKREAQRLVSTITGETGFVVFLGLGGGFAPQEALENTPAQVLVIDFCLDSIAQLFSAMDYTRLLKDGRFSLLVDPDNDEIYDFIITNYRPSICGGVKSILLRTRTELDLDLFDAASKVIQEAIETVSSDYSVQAHFGIRWFSNIIRNLKTAETATENFTQKYPESPVFETAIVAAGPSLDQQLTALAEYKSRKVFIICSDTALPVLLHHGIEPDTVVSIDCQHISYYHFIGCKMDNIPLVLDIASPPLLCGLSSSPLFFTGGHPLAQYVSANWQPFPYLDTSGGNVTYACLSLAENLGAQRITLFGADFSYINSRTYARGTYIYPFFEKKQNRLSPLEALSSAFLYRSPFLPPEDEKKSGYYETSSLRFYRKKLEEKAAVMNAHISCAQGLGAALNLKSQKTMPYSFSGFFAKKSGKNSMDFLGQYRNDIKNLPAAHGKKNYLKELDAKNTQIFFTLLPSAAALKQRNPRLIKIEDLIEETKRYCLNEIDLVRTL
jgi:hypothetical protein